MSENSGMKKRKYLSNYVRIELYEQLKRISDETKIPMSKLLDEAIEELIKKRG